MGGFFAFYYYQNKTSSSQESYQLWLGNILAPMGYANGVPVTPELTPNHGQLVQIEILVATQSSISSNGFLADFINPVNWTGNFSYNSRYTIGQIIIIYRIYQDGYAERTNSTILLTQQILFGEHPPGPGEPGPVPRAFFIPPQQWVPA